MIPCDFLCSFAPLREIGVSPSVPSVVSVVKLDEKVHILIMTIESDLVESFPMKITAQEEYGLRCVLRLTKAESGSTT